MVQQVTANFVLDYGVFILHSSLSSRSEGWVSRELLVLVLKTEAKKVFSISAFSSFVSVSPHIQRRLGIILSPPFVANVFIGTSFIVF